MKNAAAAQAMPAGSDLPYYDDRPVAISGARWWFLMATVALGFAVLIAPLPLLRDGWGRFVPAVAFFAIPMLGLRMVAGRHWAAVFRRVGWRELLWMFGFALLNIVVTVLIGATVLKLFDAARNPAFALLAGQTGDERLLFFLRTLPQLFGEEVLSILPLLALAWLFHRKLAWPRSRALLCAWLLSALWFGAAHLPTYDWNLVQCLVVIGSARLVLSLAYLKSRNLWVSFGAHAINDWSMFGLGLWLGAGAA